jgi:hypothetical protein
MNITLSSDESLVLYELLSNFAENDKLLINDNSEKIVLWNLLSLLEKELVEPFDKNYINIIEQARERINKAG